jgi:hypothetical protein
MKPIKIISFSLLILALPACQKEPFLGVNGKGSNTVETVNYQSFSKIDLGFDADVFYTQDSVYKIEISAQSNIQRVLVTEVSKSTLVLRASKRLLRHNPIQIIVHSPEIKGFFVSGRGNVYAKNALNTTSMDLNVSGSGSISIPVLNADQITTEISGSGKIVIEGGNSKNQSMDISGSGSIDALGMKCNRTDIDLSGSGDIKVWVTEQLDITISGSGKVSYKGTPTLNTTISGSGKIIHL